MSENPAEQVTDRIRELTAHLNACIDEAAGMGLRVEVDIRDVEEMGLRWPMPVVQVSVTQPVR